MPANWLNPVRHINDGELVDAAVTSRPDRDNEANVRRLRDRVDASGLSESLVIHSAIVAPDVTVGSPVYFNADNRRFEPAKAAAVTDPDSSVMTAAPSADCLGVCLNKRSSDVADIITAGRAKIDLAIAVGEPPSPGRYYLSSSRAGGLSLQKTPMSVPVLFLDADGYSHVGPMPRNLVTDHVHYRFDLVCAPAGDASPPSPGDPYVISNPDATKPGWLPADHPVFLGRAPVGVAFGYNLGGHPALNRVWPPLPVESASLFWDRLDSGVPGGVLLGDGIATIDANGIWWVKDSYGDTPWQSDYDTANPPLPEEIRRITLSYGVRLSDTVSGMVTRLRSDSPALKFVDAGGESADSGDLTAVLSIDGGSTESGESGDLVYKAFRDGKFQKGPVVEGIVAGVGIVATATRPGTGMAQGVVTLSAQADTAAKSLSPQVVRVSGVIESIQNRMPSYSFPSGRRSELLMTFKVPESSGPSVLTPRAKVLSTAAGTLPALTASRRIAAAATTPAALPTADVPVAFPAVGSLSVGFYVDAELDSFPVDPGDLVSLTIVRSAGDGFAGGVGLFDVTCLLEPA